MVASALTLRARVHAVSTAVAYPPPSSACMGALMHHGPRIVHCVSPVQVTLRMRTLVHTSMRACAPESVSTAGMHGGVDRLFLICPD